MTKKKPTIDIKAFADDKSPKLSTFFAGLAITMPACFKPNKAINKPIPTPTDTLILCGITRTIKSRIPRNDTAIKITPLINTIPDAILSGTPSPNKVNEKIATLPKPGPSTKGRLV